VVHSFASPRSFCSSRLTQIELAELAGVGLRLVSELERGKPTLRIDAVNRVLHVFGMMVGPVAAPRESEDEEAQCDIENPENFTE
jgi:transcriptional regulator with XRE-family HTH domain